MSRSFETLSPKEVLALAIHVERANTRRFRAFADTFKGYDAEVTTRFEELAAEEERHEQLLVAQFRERFGDAIPPIEEEDVKGVVESIELDDAEHLIFDSLKPHRIFELALKAEQEAQEFYRRAVQKAPDEKLKSLYRQLADMEGDHARWCKEKLRLQRPVGGKR